MRLAAFALLCCLSFSALAAPPTPAPAGPLDAAAHALALARRIPIARKALHECRLAAAAIKDDPLRAAVESQLQAPWLAPDAFAYVHPAEAEAQLRRAGLLGPDEKLALPISGKGNFASAPGGACPSGHHAYPGGLAVHTWANLLHARSLAADYKTVYGVHLNDDWLVAATLWHDTGKAATLQWHDDAGCGPEPLLARTPLHHILGIAAAILKHLPSPLVVVIASAHAPPFAASNADLCGYLKAGGILATGDAAAVPCPSLAKDAPRPPIEAYVENLSDADFVFTVPAWDWYQSQIGTGWARFEALIQDGSDVSRWHEAQLR